MPDKVFHGDRSLVLVLQNTFNLVYHKYFAIIIWIVAISCLIIGWTYFFINADSELVNVKKGTINFKVQKLLDYIMHIINAL